MTHAQRITEHPKAMAFIRDRVASAGSRWRYVSDWQDTIHGIQGGAVSFAGKDATGHDVNCIVDYELPIEPFALAKRVAICLDGKLPLTLRGPSRPL